MNNDALRQLYERYSREIYLYLLSLCKDGRLAEDLMQETFLKALLSLDETHANLRAWLYTVARNLFYDGARRRKLEQSLTESMLSDAPQDPDELLEMQGFDEERYPHLSLFSLAQETHPDTDYASEELMREHIASLLSYCADNREGMKLFYSAGDIDELLDGCRASADYIRENGFSVYGIVFIGDKEQIENVYGLDNVAYMYSEELD